MIARLSFIALLVLGGVVAPLHGQVQVARSDRWLAWNANAVVRDIALQSEASLHGQVVDAEGMALANCELWVTAPDGSVVKARTDASGRFVVRSLSPGDYRIDTARGGGKYRLWNPKEAPRDAASNVLLVVNARSSG